MVAHPLSRCSFITLLSALLISILACGGDDVPVGQSKPTFPTVILAAGLAVEPDSDEAQILAMLDRTITAARDRDFVAFAAECRPDLQAENTPEDMEVWLELIRSDPRNHREIYTDSFNLVVHSFRRSLETMSVTVDWREGEDVFRAGVAAFYERVEGRWYFTVPPCHELKHFG